MIFVIDLDDTVCDTNAYSEEYIKDFIEKHKWPVKFVDTISRFAEGKFDWDYETALKWYKTYGDEMMLHFPIKNNAVKIINSLFDMGHSIIICTARETDWHSKPKEITMQWIENVGLKYNKIYIGRVDKEKVCEEENADVFIDDDLKIVSRVVDYFKSTSQNKQAFLSTTDYNQNLETPKGAIRVDNFKEMITSLGIRQKTVG